MLFEVTKNPWVPKRQVVLLTSLSPKLSKGGGYWVMFIVCWRNFKTLNQSVELFKTDQKSWPKVMCFHCTYLCLFFHRRDFSVIPKWTEKILIVPTRIIKSLNLRGWSQLQELSFNFLFLNYFLAIKSIHFDYMKSQSYRITKSRKEGACVSILPNNFQKAVLYSIVVIVKLGSCGSLSIKLSHTCSCFPSSFLCFPHNSFHYRLPSS